MVSSSPKPCIQLSGNHDFPILIYKESTNHFLPQFPQISENGVRNEHHALPKALAGSDAIQHLFSSFHLFICHTEKTYLTSTTLRWERSPLMFILIR